MHHTSRISDQLMYIRRTNEKTRNTRTRHSPIVAIAAATLALCLAGGAAEAQRNRQQGQQQQPQFFSFRSALSTGTLNWCMDVPGGQFQAGTTVAIASCNGSPQQSFNYETRINLTAAGFCLDGLPQQENQPIAEGDPAGLNECTGTDNQVWELQPFKNNPNLFSIVSPLGLCVTVGDRIRGGTPLVLVACQEDVSQGWTNRQIARPAGNPRVQYGTYTEPQYYQYRGSRYCYYGDGDQAWNGNGWYTCGQYREQGIGYGGPQYWNNWYYPGQPAYVDVGGGGFGVGGVTTFFPTSSPTLVQTTSVNTTNTTISTTTTTIGTTTVATTKPTTTVATTTTKPTTTTLGLPTTTKPATTTLGLPTTTKPVTTTLGLPTTTKPVTTTLGLTTTTKPVTTTLGQLTTTKPITTTLGLTTTTKPVTTTLGQLTTTKPKGTLQLPTTTKPTGTNKFVNRSGTTGSQQFRRSTTSGTTAGNQFKTNKFTQTNTPKFTQTNTNKTLSTSRSNITRTNISRPVTNTSRKPSDIALKHDLVRIGSVADGIALYRFQYNWSDQIYVGVIAQEVEATRPDAVVLAPDGYLHVDYGMLGVRFQTWEQWLSSGGTPTSN
ncbi:MAG TPA: ricin-type beta-trefoil lectin domain protein [Xanthobacteraceae bacterium]|nr:ricin-type beta-trefoil lectin domain protein [Xanthobacteraceae bacterium]